MLLHQPCMQSFMLHIFSKCRIVCGRSQRVCRVSGQDWRAYGYADMQDIVHGVVCLRPRSTLMSSSSCRRHTRTLAGPCTLTLRRTRMQYSIYCPGRGSTGSGEDADAAELLPDLNLLCASKLLENQAEDTCTALGLWYCCVTEFPVPFQIK